MGRHEWDVERGRSEAEERAAVLTRESHVFCRYLLGVEPTPYLTERYLAAHRARPDSGVKPPFDVVLLRLAARSPIPTRVCDAYARIFAPRGLLRRKLSLLLAIAETSPELYRRVEAVDPGGRAALVVRLIGQLTVWLLAVGAGVVLLAPVHLGSQIVAAEPEVGPETCQPPPRGKE